MSSSNYAIVQSNDRILGVNKSTGQTMLEIDAEGNVDIGGSLTLNTNPSGTVRYQTDDITASVYSPDGSVVRTVMPAPMAAFTAWRYLDALPFDMIANLEWTMPKSCRTSAENTYYLLLTLASEGVVDSAHRSTYFDFSYAWSSQNSRTYTAVGPDAKIFRLVDTAVTTLQTSPETSFPIVIPGAQAWPLNLHIRLARIHNINADAYTGILYLQSAQIKYPVGTIGA
jgi:hypothetical protein